MSEQSQINKLAGVLVEHSSHFASMPGADRQWVIEHTKDAIDLLTTAVKNRVKKLLSFAGTVSIPARRKKEDSREFFNTRDGLHVLDDFRDRILSVVTEASRRKATISAYDLTKSMTDEEIRAELGAGHVFEDASIFCEYLKELLIRQKNGEKGDLLTDSYANILYVRGVNSEVFAVDVRRDAVTRRWYVDARRLDDNRWGAGIRVLSATAA